MGNPSHDSSFVRAYVKGVTLTAKHTPILAILLSGGLLIGAWIFQYGFGYAPCTMCYWQRHAHKAVIALAALALVIGLYKPSHQKGLIWLTALALLVSAGIAFWHVGVEYKWWDGPKTCAGGGALGAFDPNDPLGGLDKKIRPPACSDAVWHFLGLSMAAWNAIASVIGAVVIFGLSGKGKAHD